MHRTTLFGGVVLVLALTITSGESRAESVEQALASAYSSNPQINSARAQTRADDENVPIARSGYRPIVSAFATAVGQYIDSPLVDDDTTLDGAVGLQVTQNLFTGFRVRNAIRQSQASVLASRELLRNTVQNVLFDSAQAYMDVLRDVAILDIRERNVIFLDEQVRAANERFDVGENTRTDVAQARARLATARASLSLARANLAVSQSTYRRLIGHDPTGLKESFPFSRLIPSTLAQAIVLGEDKHPIILATIHQADAQAFVVKQVEGEALPTLSVVGTLQHEESFDNSIDSNTATIAGRLSIPIYQGGAIAGRARQAKEQYGLRKIEIDVARDQVRSAIVAAWAQAEAAAEAINAAQEGVSAADAALSGVQEEQRVGQRTTLDVLDAQRELLIAQETLVVARRDRTVSLFALLSAMGRLSAEELSLAAPVYDPAEHYRHVENKWYGFWTPDGR